MNKSIRDKVRELWKLCFNDSEAFIEMYFQMRYNSDINIAIESGEEVIAALQMLPYPMTLFGNVIQTAYISGACTHPDYRNRGAMRELLTQAFSQMYRRDKTLTTLIPAEPWLFDYYARMGYATVFYYGKRTFRISTNEAENASETPDLKLLNENAFYKSKIITTYDEAAYQYLNQKLHQRPSCIQHTSTDFHVILSDLQLGNGRIFTLTYRQKIVALAVAYPDTDPFTLQIGELLADNSEAEQRLLNRICRETKATTLNITTPPSREEAYPLGMARIIHPKTILQLYASTHPGIEMNIALTDEQLSANNGYYYLNNGRCMFSQQRLPGPHRSFSIAELTKRILTTEHPYMSLMLN